MLICFVLGINLLGSLGTAPCGWIPALLPLLMGLNPSKPRLLGWSHLGFQLYLQPDIFIHIYKYRWSAMATFVQRFLFSSFPFLWFEIQLWEKGIFLLQLLLSRVTREDCEKVTFFAWFPQEIVFTDVSFPMYFLIYGMGIINLPAYSGYIRQITWGAHMAFIKIYHPFPSLWTVSSTSWAAINRCEMHTALTSCEEHIT